MKDISSRKDIEKIVNTFYTEALADQEIGHFFTKVVELDLSHHIPKICDFWEMVLLGSGPYKDNPMEKHFQLHRKSPIADAHFTRWLYLWKDTVLQLFKGPKADEAINRAQQIAGVMQLKIKTLQH